MRTVLLVLVLANIALFAWSRYPASGPAGTAPREHEPERLPIVPAHALEAVPDKAASARCLEWGAFTLADSARAVKALEPLSLGERLIQRRAEETAGWWVYIPSQGSSEAAQRAAAELKALGIRDYSIVGGDGELRWTLSLGIFRTVDAAQARLVALRAQGVRSAIIAPRDAVVPAIWLQVTNVDPALAARLQAIAREVEGSELRPCPG